MKFRKQILPALVLGVTAHQAFADGKLVREDDLMKEVRRLEVAIKNVQLNQHNVNDKVNRKEFEELRTKVSEKIDDSQFEQLWGVLDMKVDNHNVNELILRVQKLEKNNGTGQEQAESIADLKQKVKSLGDDKAEATIVENLNKRVQELEQNSASGLGAAPINAASKDELNAVNTRVDGMEKSMKSGLAANAALGALFQPYNVGKVNITAAMGGYKTATALAVGAGYRANEHFAVKAGVAAALQSKGAFTYHLGVNYEF